MFVGKISDLTNKGVGTGVGGQGGQSSPSFQKFPFYGGK
jgi:hypothetical protein